MTKEGLRILIVDACVLIDFLDTEPSVFAIVARAVGPIYVASPVLSEEVGIDAAKAERLGLAVVEPPGDIFEQSARTRGGLSFHDLLGLLMAKAEGWTLVTNDKALRSACERDGVDVLWGLQMLGLAVEAGALAPHDAIELVNRIAEINPTIGGGLVRAFAERYRRIT